MNQIFSAASRKVVGSILGRCTKMTTTLRTDYLEYVGASTSHNPVGLLGLLHVEFGKFECRRDYSAIRHAACGSGDCRLATPPFPSCSSHHGLGLPVDRFPTGFTLTAVSGTDSVEHLGLLCLL
jgi:hypothetical protein